MAHSAQEIDTQPLTTADTTPPSAKTVDENPQVRAEVDRRRTFAIISHPDAGKTTLTEKLLLYSGCVEEAGAVRGRKTQRATTSDWMQLERERGISITSTVLSFDYGGYRVNLLDTPGHQDFSEDTYRTLMAADSAVMVIDAVKGIEAQTLKLFKVCALRKIPILTFINKMDRPGSKPLELLSQIEEVLGISAVPLNWPIGEGRDFQGIYDRQSQQALLFQPVPRGSHRVPTELVDFDSLADRMNDRPTIDRLTEEIELLDGAGGTFDRQRFLNGEVTPVFFGSALSNFGVEPFLNAFLELSPPPGPRMSQHGPLSPGASEFSGIVFKIQANLDPKHHDRVAFVRICTGRFTREMEVLHCRTGKKFRVNRSQRVLGRGRETVEEAYPGDIIGLSNPGQFRLGDTLSERQAIHYEGLWEFAPECFATLRCADTGRRKQFSRGIQQLVEEGAVQVLHDPQSGSQEPMLAAVGELQFEVVQYRLESEYNAKTNLQRLPFEAAYRVEGSSDAMSALRLPTNARLMHDQYDRPVVLFTGDWERRFFHELNPELHLREPNGGEPEVT